MSAGISNWETYYYNTDITQFCPNYLGFTPVDDKAIYELTSPMTRIHEASTPTLIQHGELDQRGTYHPSLPHLGTLTIAVKVALQALAVPFAC